jgi:hypothetical protein
MATYLQQVLQPESELVVPDGDNPNTQQTPEYTKDKYNVKIMK